MKHMAATTDEAARTPCRENSPDWDQWQAKRGHLQDNSQCGPSGRLQQAAYLALLHATSTLVETFFECVLLTPFLLGDALSCGAESHDFQPQDGDDGHRQKSWNQLRAVAAVNWLMEGAVDDTDRACLLASRSKES